MAVTPAVSGSSQSIPGSPLIEIRDISGIAARQLLQAVKIYRNSFPANESRPVGDVMELLERGVYTMYAAVEGSGADAPVAGFMLLYPLDSDCVLLDYMAVRAGARGRGTGSIMMGYLRDHVLGTYGTVLLEIQLPQGDGIQAKRDRIRFYVSHGVRPLTDSYVMPGYGRDGSEVMSLMYMGRRPEDLGQVTASIHFRVYGKD